MPRPSCLIVGAAGFVGSALIAAAQRSGWEVSGATRESLSTFAGRSFDTVFFAAGNARRYAAGRDPQWDFRESVDSVAYCLDILRFGHFALVSSVDVYPEHNEASATHPSVDIDLDRLAPYGRHKRMAELLVAERCASWQIFRLAQMVGPGLRKGPVYDLLDNRELWIDPASEFPVLHTATVGEIACGLVDDGPRNRVYNVCGRGSVRFDRIAARLVGTRPLHSVAQERQVYRIRTDETEEFVGLPDSCEELEKFARECGV